MRISSSSSLYRPFSLPSCITTITTSSVIGCRPRLPVTRFSAIATPATSTRPSPPSKLSTSLPASNRSINGQIRRYTSQNQNADSRTMTSATSFFDFEARDKKGEPLPLANFKGKVILAVNTASKCGFTPQFKGLEELYQTIQKKEPGAFTIIGFPCNQFGGQDPGSDDEIQSFCQVNYGVTFPVVGKADVNGDNAAPVWTWMKAEHPGLMGLKRVKWNFEKFLIGADGKVVGRWASTTKPESLEETILKEIEKGKKEGTLAEAGKKEEAA